MTRAMEIGTLRLRLAGQLHLLSLIALLMSFVVAAAELAAMPAAAAVVVDTPQIPMVL